MNPPKSSPSKGGAIESAFDSPTFKLDMSIKVDAPVGAMSISPSSRDVVLASKQGLHIVDLDNPYDPPRFFQHLTAWSVADVQWSPHASHAHWVVSTSNQKAIVWNLAMPSHKAIEHVLQSHTRAITDINFSAHDPNTLATCSVDSMVHCWDLRAPRRPAVSFADWFAGATQVKYNRQNPHILASAHDRYLYIWDTRMGARAVRKINAHTTKIYGLDWNRTRPTGIITCALDKSVRFWDYDYAPNDTPERIIHTSFPVWRARHTPFGWGVLTMPLRGDTSLYLWDRRRTKSATPDVPVTRFEGHTDNVKEFLWRWRGGQRDDGNDDREFQLVTWGLDKDIRLWDIDKDTMAKIGHDPSKKMRFRVTRKGAKYMTYRNEAALAKLGEKELKEKEVKQPPPKLTLTVDGARIRKDGLFAGQKGGLAYGIGQQLNQANGNKNDDDRRFERALTGVREGGFMRVGRRKPIEVNPITWMKGVKIGRKVSEGGMEASRSSARGDFGLSWDAPENLGDEVSYVGSKFNYITFEKVNIAARTCTLSLTGPWGFEEKRIFVRADVSFPSDYPTDGRSIPEFKLEKTNNISDENIERIDLELKKIASALVNRRRVCLEACLCYLLGERHDNALSDEDPDSSSDDEEIVNTKAIGDEEEGLNSLINSTKQASVPLPKSCGAVWASNGQLVCFFPPKEDRMGKGLLSSLAARESERSSMRIPGGGRLWEGFGRLYLTNPSKGDTDVEPDSSDSSYSSNDSSDGDTDLHHVGPLRPSFGWRLQGNSSLARGLRRGGSTDRSTQRSTGTGVRTTATVTAKRKSIVSIHDLAHILPAKIQLAKEYRIGEGVDVCKHNATVAEKYGFRDLADVWRLVEMVLCDDVPLEIYGGVRDRIGSWGDTIMVMARRAYLESGRRDSGLGMDFDDDEDLALSDSEFRGRVKWGAHPMGGWLIEQLFEYFEKKADIQMLAMLSCVLSETEDKSGKSDILPNGIDIPPFKRQTSFSREYYPSIEMVVQSQHSNYSISPSHHSAAITPIGTTGSYGSSAGAPHFVGGSDPLMPYSTGTTPPTTNLRPGPEDWSSNGISLSASPEQHHHFPFRRSASASVVRTFNGSPPPLPRTRQRVPSPAEGMLVPFATSGVTWGATTTFGSSKAASDTATEETSIGDSTNPISINMYNTSLLEGHESLPLLPQSKKHFLKCYRENYADLLYTWNLQIPRLEILKFSTPDATPASPILLSVTPKRTNNGLEIAGLCSKCAGILDVTSGARGECKACKRRQVTMTCVVCEVIVKGLYGMCAKCGHVAHAKCHREWFCQGQQDIGMACCPTGCGCRCMSDDDEGEGWEEVPVLVRSPEAVAERNDIESWAYGGEYLW